MKNIEIQKLIDCIEKSGLAEVSIETDAIKMHIKRSIPMPVQLPPVAYSTLPPVMPSAVSMPDASIVNQAEGADKDHYITIKSPMIGTFYRSPHPEAPPFVKEGDIISCGTKLCIVEAMKLYNEIESEVTGKIAKILLDDISPVEYDQPLFLVDPT